MNEDGKLLRCYRNKLIVVGLLVVLLVAIQVLFSDDSLLTTYYGQYVFRPFQQLRNRLLNVLPFSLGDVLYFAGSIGVAVLLGKWVYYLIKIKTYYRRFVTSIVRTLSCIGILYILFFAGWGGNYYKPTLSRYWALPIDSNGMSDSALYQFDSFLIQQLNKYVSQQKTYSLTTINHRAQQYYKQYLPQGIPLPHTKPSLLGNSLQYAGIQGYYNPFTGEAQVNKQLPGFLLPFVVCHEMAHQQGIAAEDDANLLAYAISTSCTDTAFRYAAYFNVWLYTHRKLRRKDSLLANQLKATLNPITIVHVDTLKRLREKYSSSIGDYSSDVYDEYLKLHRQHEGIHSYTKVGYTAWVLEEQRKKRKNIPLKIP